MSLTIKRSTIKYYIDIIIALIFFNPQSLSQIPLANTIVDALRFLIFIIFLIKWLYTKQVNSLHIFVFLFFISRFVSTIIADDNVFTVITLFFPILAMLLFIDTNKNNLHSLIKSVYTAAALLIALNAVSLVLCPNGLYSTSYGHNIYWIIGQKQDWNTVYIAFLICSLITWDDIKLRFKTVFIYACIVYSFTVQLPLGLVLYFVIVLFLFVISKKRKILKAKQMFFANLVAECILIVVAFSFGKLNWLNTILSGISANEVLTKRDTVLVRVYMWREGLPQFSHSPILGVGNISDYRWNSLFNYATYHPNFHNTPIDILVTSGIIGLFAYMMIYIYTARKLDKSLSRHSVVITYGIFGINILMLTEGIYAPFVWFFIFLGYYIQDLDRDIQTATYSEVERKRKKNEIFNLHRTWNR